MLPGNFLGTGQGVMKFWFGGEGEPKVGRLYTAAPRNRGTRQGLG
jgi:hypothetical protein